MFLEEQNKKKQPHYVYKSGQSNSRKVKTDYRKQTLSEASALIMCWDLITVVFTHIKKSKKFPNNCT